MKRGMAMRYPSGTWTKSLFLATVAAASLSAPAGAEPLLTVRPLGDNLRFDRPIFMTAPPGDHERLFVVEQHTGQIRIVNRESQEVEGTPFLDVPLPSNLDNEQGLLGLAFHPDYAENGYFYVNFTSTGGRTVVRRYQVSNNPNIANASSGQDVLSFAQPFPNHNGGWMDFGPNDGYLYIASGDGGSGNDPGNRSQDITNQFLGKILRIDVNGDDFPEAENRNYAIPPTNPFVDAEGDDEIWAYGVRNPWRPSFDRLTGDLYIADVGQAEREEINFQPADSPGGENYGWRVMEGTRPTGLGGVVGLDLTAPIHEYNHSVGQSITGGYVYRGEKIGGDLAGTYFYADFVANRVWSFRYDGESLSNLTERTRELFENARPRPTAISSFGEDADGNLYIVSLSGRIFQLTAVPAMGDVDSDGDVDLNDFDALKLGFGVGATRAEGDLNEDALVDLHDFNILKAYFGTDSRSQQAAAVPEPATWMPALIGLVAYGLCYGKTRRH